MIRKLLIANRGEIACRIIATAQRLGRTTVAVYSDADAEALHVKMADEAVRIGPAPVADSYLQAARLIEAAKQTGADAIHPGYGFLSENPDFVEQVQDAGLTFVGPNPRAIRAMGLKDAAKALMEHAHVPVVPGYHGDSQDPDELAQHAQAIGYPVLIKARAGGGGKGMRLVETPAEFATALGAAQREAEASFGDAQCLIEKYITQPRHIEIQVFADAHGNAVHLFERDCSLQRRHQKVIEEAPAPDMPQDVRNAMGAAAVEAARAIDYRGAGTVEFIVDGSTGLRKDGFWFMEMNTRLQVEHPVTEAITGLDLVELQLHVAEGKPLPFTQDDLKISGHAFEARIYAEDPARDFVPAIGHVQHLQFPGGTAFARAPVRIDSGIRAGDAISPHYDPMIAKLIVHGPDRPSALASLTRALQSTEIAGLTTNVPFLTTLSQHADFAQGRVDTGLIARDMDQLVAEAPASAAVRAIAALAGLGLLEAPDSPGPWDQLRGFRSWGVARHVVRLVHQDAPFESIVECGATLVVDGAPIAVRNEGSGRYRVEMADSRHVLAALVWGDVITVLDQGRPYVFQRPDLRQGAAADIGSSDTITSPMPGQVTALRVKAGDQVAAGQALIILEAMKMEHTLVAPREGVVAEVMAAKGDQVEDGSILIRLEATEATDG